MSKQNGDHHCSVNWCLFILYTHAGDSSVIVCMVPTAAMLEVHYIAAA